MENFWRNLLWIMSVLTAMFGVAMMLLSVYGGAVSLVGAVLLMPPVCDWIGRLIGQHWIIPIIGFLTALMIGPIVALATAPTLEEILAKTAQRNVANHASGGVGTG